MLKRLRLAAVPFVAGAIIALTTASGWAFTQQTLNPNGNYNFNYGDPDDKAKFSTSPNKSDSNTSGFHFSIERGQTGPFGFHSFGGDGTATPPEPYATPLGNGN
jgi:hypothetical protein